MSEHNFEGAFLMIPAIVADDPDLSPLEVLLFGRLIQLARKEGYCWAGNQFLADKMKVSLSSLKRSLKSLENKEYIRSEVEKKGMETHRKIYTCMTDFKKFSTKVHQWTDRGFTSEPIEGSPVDRNIYNKKQEDKKSKSKEQEEEVLPASQGVCPSHKVKVEEDKEKEVGSERPKKEKEFVHQRPQAYFGLNPEQQSAYNELMSLEPMDENDEHLKPHVVINWLTKANMSPQRAKQLAEMYRQDKIRYANRGACIENMGGYINTAFQGNRANRSNQFAENKKIWDEIKGGISKKLFNEGEKFIYFSYVGKDLSFDIATEQFKKSLKEYVMESAKIYKERYAEDGC